MPKDRLEVVFVRVNLLARLGNADGREHAMPRGVSPNLDKTASVHLTQLLAGQESRIVKPTCDETGCRNAAALQDRQQLHVIVNVAIVERKDNIARSRIGSRIRERPEPVATFEQPDNQCLQLVRPDRVVGA